MESSSIGLLTSSSGLASSPRHLRRRRCSQVMPRRARKRYLCSLLDDDRAFHIGVELAEIVEGTGLIEGLAVAIARVERSRLEHATILGSGGVGDGIAVGPGHGRANRDLDRVRDVGEVLDIDQRGLRHSLGVVAGRGAVRRFLRGAGEFLDEVDTDVGLFALFAENRYTRVPRIVQLTKSDNER